MFPAARIYQRHAQIAAIVALSPVKTHPPMSHGHSDENWQSCYRQLAPKLLLFARQWLPSTADAEDVVQTAFVKFWRHRPDAAPEHYPLLYSAVRTSALDFLRGNDRRMRRENDPDGGLLRDDEPFFDTAIEQRENSAIVEAAMRELPHQQREVLVLRIWSDLTFAQIGETLGESINTVASRYRYALEALRKQLKPHEYERV
jgi:RNA polymerase sigma-70 factor (ECF subfamily)